MVKRMQMNAEHYKAVSKLSNWEPAKYLGEYESNSPLPVKSIPHTTCDLRGLRSGKFTVIGLSNEFGSRWVVQCDCGVYTVKTAKSIKSKLNNHVERCVTCKKVLYNKRKEFFDKNGFNAPNEHFDT